MDLTDDQYKRYARHMIMDEVGEDGQQKLLASRVLLVGAGGLGSPMAVYLAAAGVGTLGIIDDDVVELSNLQRQIAHLTPRLGMRKVESAALMLGDINPDVRVEAHPVRLNADNAADVVARYDLVADGSDNFATRFLLNEICYRQGKTLVSGALLRFDGQLTTLKAGRTLADGTAAPCYRCLFPEAPTGDAVSRCDQAGIFGAVAGVIGTLQATEVLKELLGLGDSMAGKLLLYEGMGPRFTEIGYGKRDACPLCGTG